MSRAQGAGSVALGAKTTSEVKFKNVDNHRFAQIKNKSGAQDLMNHGLYGMERIKLAPEHFPSPGGRGLRGGGKLNYET